MKSLNFVKIAKDIPKKEEISRKTFYEINIGDCH
jgi:hypothetical protein